MGAGVQKLGDAALVHPLVMVSVVRLSVRARSRVTTGGGSVSPSVLVWSPFGAQYLDNYCIVLPARKTGLSHARSHGRLCTVYVNSIKATWLGNRGTGILLNSRESDPSLLHSAQAGSGTHPASSPIGYRDKAAGA